MAVKTIERFLICRLCRRNAIDAVVDGRVDFVVQRIDIGGEFRGPENRIASAGPVVEQ